VRVLYKAYYVPAAWIGLTALNFSESAGARGWPVGILYNNGCAAVGIFYSMGFNLCLTALFA